MKKLILTILGVLWLARIVSATEITLQNGLSGYSGTTDSYIQADDADTNFGTSTQLSIHDSWAPGYQWPIIKFDVSSIPAGSTINSAILSIYQEGDVGGACSIYVYRVFKSWTSSGVTWNDWINPDSEWGTAGCNNANDGGSDNSEDGSGYDRVSTASATYSRASWEGVGFKNWDITTLVDGWVNGTMVNNGVRIGTSLNCNYDGASDFSKFTSSEGSTSANRPKLIINYTEGATPSSRSRPPIVSVY